jgi:hypothetical protein
VSVGRLDDEFAGKATAVTDRRNKERQICRGRKMILTLVERENA